MRNSKLTTLVECALLLAVGNILAMIKIFEMPNGGSITLLSMLPFIIISFRHGTRWGLITGFANALLQMLMGGLWTPPAGTFIALVGEILLDYVLAFMVLGLAGALAKPFGGKTAAGAAMGTALACLMRFLCSFVSGFLIWASLVEDGLGAVIYSLTYNASYMVPETVLTVIAAVLLYKKAPSIFNAAK
ncbi:MAG: energy-coupled thiamine transporter ThiT [Firmicutes bacterium]|nr:energy-coupled thiamine transporter ThiT [Bacillota bacterium]